MNKLIKQLPSYYRTSAVMRAIMDGNAAELERLSDYIKEAAVQLNVSTATYALDMFEQDLKITSGDLMNDETRRARIYAKKHGDSIVTLDVLKEFIERITGKEVTAKENFQNSMLEFKFTDSGGRVDIDLIMNTVDDYVPAHLGYLIDRLSEQVGQLNIGGVCGLSKSRFFVGYSPPEKSASVNMPMPFGGMVCYSKKQTVIKDGTVTWGDLENYTCEYLAQFTCEQIERGEFINGTVEQR